MFTGSGRRRPPGLAAWAWVLAALAVAAGACGDARDRRGPWTELEPGLEVARFDSRVLSEGGAGDLTVLRVDPGRWDLRLLTAEQVGGGQARTVQQWCEDFDLAAAVNAGMFQQDGKTHVGFCQVDGSVLNGFANGYQSAAGLDPLDPADPAFRIFDLDQTPLPEVAARYRTVVQNLRLVKRPGQNLWKPGPQRWPEAALGEDARGRALLIHCTTPYGMHEFNRVLLSLPLDLACAQHLEGNTPARLWIRHPRFRADRDAPGGGGPPLPFVLGVAPRSAALGAPAGPSP